MVDRDMVTVFHFYVCVFQIFLFFLNKRQRFMTIYDKKSFLNTSILQKGHQHELERFANKYKQIKKPIVLKRKNEVAMTLQDTYSYKQNCVNVVNPFDDIIEINTKTKTVHVGAMIEIGKLMNYLYPLGYALPVVPEFKSLTVGGLIVGGGGISSSSANNGYFHLHCIEYTVVLGNGEIIKVSKEKHAELFSALPLSYGTLGTIVDVKMSIIKIKPNVLLEFECLTSEKEVERVVTRSKDYDFMEGIMYSKDRIVMIKGIFVDKLVYPVIDNTMWYDEYYYQYINTYSKEGKKQCSMNGLEYYFRHDRGAYWIGKSLIGDDVIGRTINPFINHASDKHNLSHTILRQLFDYNKIIMEDVMIPSSLVSNVVSAIDSTYTIYPLWLCPCRMQHEDAFYINIGIYGSVGSLKDTIDYNGFMKTIRGSIVLKKKDKDMENYHVLRKTYHAEGAFPTIDEKVKLRFY